MTTRAIGREERQDLIQDPGLDDEGDRRRVSGDCSVDIADVVEVEEVGLQGCIGEFGRDVAHDSAAEPQQLDEAGARDNASMPWPRRSIDWDMVR